MAGLKKARHRGAGALVAFATVTALVLGGCGSGGDSSSTTASKPPPEAQSKQEINALLDDFYSADNTAKCQTLSDKAIQTMGSMQACLSNDAPATKTPFRVISIKITGDKATVHLQAGESPPTDVFLVYEDGAWKWDHPVPLAVQL